MNFLKRNKGNRKNWRKIKNRKLLHNYKKNQLSFPKKIYRRFPFRFLFIFVLSLSLFSIGSIFVYQYYLLKIIPNNDSLNLQNCSSLNNDEITNFSDTYGYFILMNNQKIFKTYLLHINEVTNKSDTKINTIKIPGSLWIKTINSPSFKYSTVDNIFKAGLVDHLEDPFCFSIKNLSYQIGAPVDFVIVENNTKDYYLENILSSPRSANFINKFSNLYRVKNLSSTLSVNAIFNLQNSLAKYKSVTRNYELNNELTSKIITSEGNTIHVFDFQLFLDKYPEALSSKLIYKEQALIEIYNATDINLIASIYSRYIKSIGGNVIRLGNISVNNVESDLDIYITNQKQYPLTINAVRKLFVNKSIHIIYNQRPKGVVTTGDIILIIHSP